MRHKVHAAAGPEADSMTLARHGILSLLALASLWWLLSGGDPASWLVGIPAVLAATWAARRLQIGERWTISALGILRFLPLFLWESLRGGIDVARRTLAPRLRIQPGFTLYRTGLQQPSARVFFANCVCLLPGTLAADLQCDRLRVHMLDAALDPQLELQRLERAVALIYRESDCETGGAAL
jgi:multicomponent Na+:H+ antiporter subunit E